MSMVPSSPSASFGEPSPGASRPNSRLHPDAARRTTARRTLGGYYELGDVEQIVVVEADHVEQDHFLGRLVIVVDGLQLSLDEIVGIEHSLLEQDDVVGFVFVHGETGELHRACL